MRSGLRRSDTLMLAVAAVILVIIAALSYRDWQQYVRASSEAALSRTALDSVDQLLSAMLGAEIAQRGYLLTGEDGYLESYNKAAQAATGVIANLRDLVSRLPREAGDVARLSSAVDQKLAALRQTMDVRRRQSLTAAAEVLRSDRDRGKQLMDDIRAISLEIGQRESLALVERSREAEMYGHRMRLVTLIGSLIIFFFLIAATITIQKAINRREESLRETQDVRDFLETTLSSIGDAVISTDHDGRIQFANGAALSLLRRTKEEVMGHHLDKVFRIVNEDTRAAVESPVTKILREGTVVGLANHTLLIAKDGTEIPIDDNGAPIRGRDGKIHGTVLVFRDITERRKMEASHRKAQERLANVLESIDQAFVVFDREWRYVYVNREAASITRRTREEMLGKVLWEVVPRFVGGKPEQELRRAMEHRVHVHFEGYFADYHFWYEIDAYPSEEGLSCFLRDISPQKKSAEALRISEERFRRIVETAAEGILTVDAEGRVTFANDRLLELIGYRRDELSSSWFLGVVYEDEDREDALMKFNAVKCERLAPYDRRLRRKDGTPVWVNISANPLRDENGDFVGVLAMFTDITERKRAEESQKALERQLTLLIEASSSFLPCPESTDVPGTILSLAKRFIHADAYAIWRRAEGSNLWQIASMEGLSDEYNRTVADLGGNLQRLRNVPVVIEDAENIPFLPERGRAHKAEGVRSLIMVPMYIRGEIGATIVFYYRTPHRFNELETRVASALGNLAAAALETSDLYARETRLRQEAQGEERRATFLAEVGRILSGSLDYEATLAAVADLAVPSFADWASVEILDDSAPDKVRHIAVKHSNPEKVAQAHEFIRRYPPTDTDLERIVLRTGKSVLIEEVSDDLLAQRAQDADHLRIIRDLGGFKSVIMVPLIASGRSFGTLSFVTAESGRRYTGADLAFADELARRAATAVDNARLFTESKNSQEALRRSNAELQRVNEDLNQFAYSASHDLQEPLRMVAVFSQMLERKYKDRLDGEAEQYIRYVVTGALRMEKLLKDLLAYTQVDTAPHKVALVDANAVLQKALSNLRAAIQESGANVICGALPTLRIVEIHLLQLFQNIISNAIKYRGKEPLRIEIGAQPEGTDWRISIKDNGIGIAPEYAEQVFGIFKRLHGADKYSGTGIGLAICQKIVERYGGRIWIESEEGKGATFFFTIAR